MAKDEIKKLLEMSKKEVNDDYDKSVNSIKDDLTSFKKKTLERV